VSVGAGRRLANSCGHSGRVTPSPEEEVMKTASELQRDVLDELKWEPGLKAGEIGVSAHDGVVTLTGHVESYTQKTGAEKAAKRVFGVKGVANDLVVKLPSSKERDDTDVAEAAVQALKWHASVPEDRVKVGVRNGWVTLEGEVEWFYEKDSAYRAVRDLTGVKGVSNLMTVKPRATAKQVKDKIEAAFKRSAEIDARAVKVEIIGNKAILRGKVRSWAEYEEAEWAAWSAPGINTVENKLEVEGEAPAVY
jgi:osmotically-inducible protein OsmY